MGILKKNKKVEKKAKVKNAGIEELIKEENKKVLENIDIPEEEKCEVKETDLSEITVETKKLLDEFTDEAKKIDKIVNADTTQNELSDILKDELQRVTEFEEKVEEKIEDGESKLNEKQKEIMNTLNDVIKREGMSNFWNGISNGWFN